MSLRSIIKKIVYAIQLRKLRKSATLLGTHYKVNPTGSVSLSDGSTKEDIVIGDHVEIYGSLMSQNHGKIIIGNYVRFGRYGKIQASESVIIGNFVILSTNVVIVDSNNHPISILFRKVRAMKPASSTMHLWRYSQHKPIIIKDNVWVGENVRICKGVTIGENSVIAANSVVTKDVPANSIAAGNPAKVVREGIISNITEPTDCEEFNIFIKKHGTDF